MKPLIHLFLVMALGGCASDIARPIREAPANDVSLAQALKDPHKHRGAPVRWGGIIASVENRRDESWIEIVEKPLEKSGYPHNSDKSSGRFLARVSGFVDPVVFASKRLVTVAGKLEGNNARTIGEYPYLYPLVNVESVHLWALPPKPGAYYYSAPYGYDPWYPRGLPHRHRHFR